MNVFAVAAFGGGGVGGNGFGWRTGHARSAAEVVDVTGREEHVHLLLRVGLAVAYDGTEVAAASLLLARTP